MKNKLLFLLIILFTFIFAQNVKALTCSYKTYGDALMDDNYIEKFEKFSSDSNSSSLKVDLNATKINIDGTTCTIKNESKTPSDIVNTETASVYNGQYTQEFYNSISSLDDSVKAYYGLNDKNNVPKSNTRLGDFTYTQKCPPYLVHFKNTNQAYVASSESDAMEILKIIWLTNSRKQGYITIEKKSGDTDNDNKDPDASKYTSCASFGHSDCEHNKYFSCLWVEKYGHSYCNFDNLTYVKCGDSWDIPDKLPSIISFIVNFIKIVTPIILVFVSVLSLLKAVANSKEDEMKKAQSTLIRRIIAAVIVFFIIQITQFVIFKVAEDEEKDSISTCFSCMLNNDCSKNRYYKTMVGKDYECRSLNGTQLSDCH